jgi:hypothetical protein
VSNRSGRSQYTPSTITNALEALGLTAVQCGTLADKKIGPKLKRGMRPLAARDDAERKPSKTPGNVAGGSSSSGSKQQKRAKKRQNVVDSSDDGASISADDRVLKGKHAKSSSSSKQKRLKKKSKVAAAVESSDDGATAAGDMDVDADHGDSGSDAGADEAAKLTTECLYAAVTALRCDATATAVVAALRQRIQYIADVACDAFLDAVRPLEDAHAFEAKVSCRHMFIAPLPLCTRTIYMC